MLEKVKEYLLSTFQKGGEAKTYGTLGTAKLVIKTGVVGQKQ